MSIDQYPERAEARRLYRENTARRIAENALRAAQARERGEPVTERHFHNDGDEVEGKT